MLVDAMFPSQTAGIHCGEFGDALPREFLNDGFCDCENGLDEQGIQFLTVLSMILPGFVPYFCMIENIFLKEQCRLCFIAGCRLQF